jgi:hypothetical protein
MVALKLLLGGRLHPGVALLLEGVDAFAPHADVAHGRHPVAEGSHAVAQVNEDRMRGIGGGQLREEGVEVFFHSQHAGEHVFIHVAGHTGALLAGDEIEEHILAEVHEAGVVVLEATAILVVTTFDGRDGLDVGHEGAVPGALPTEAKGAVEGDQGLPGEGFFHRVSTPG